MDSAATLPVSPMPPHAESSGGSSYRLAALGVLCGWSLVHLARPQPAFPLDDPYITLHSAQVLHWGYDPNYPGVSALYGSTSAPFLALVYVLLFVLPPLFALDTACWLGVLAYVLGLVRLGRSFPLSRVGRNWLLVLGLTASFVPFHLLNGLETSWAMAALTWALALGSEGPQRQGWAALCAGGAAAIRPDLVVFAGLFVAALAVRPRPAGLLSALRRMLSLASAAALPLLACAVWYLRETGKPYPLTGSAKQYYYASGNGAVGEKLSTEVFLLMLFLLSCGPLLIGIFRAAHWRDLQPIRWAIVAFGVLMLVMYYVKFPTALVWNWFRYPVVVVPMLVWCWAGSQSFRANVHTEAPGVWLRFMALHGSAVLMIVLPLYVRDWRRFGGRGLPEVAVWCERNLPSDARLLVQDAGYIAYGTHFRIVDFVGLKTPEAIALNRALTWRSHGKRRAEVVAELARNYGAHYLVVSPTSHYSSEVPLSLGAMGWTIEEIRREGVYRVYRLQPPAVKAERTAATRQ